MEIISIVIILALILIFWIIALRFYYRLSVEMSQYATPPTKSPIIRTAIIGIYGLGLNISFVLICQYKNTIFSDAFMPTSNIFFALFFFLFLYSPILDYIFAYTYLIINPETLLTSSGFIIAIISAIIFFIPFCYILYKTSKEIEIRFNIAVGRIPKKIDYGFKKHHMLHGNPTLCGLITAISGLLFIPWCLYYDIFKAKQGLIVYQKVTKPKHDWISYDPRYPPPYNVTVETLTSDVGERLSDVDKATMEPATTPICPRCKKPLVYLEEHKKWWCKKCKRAG